MLQLDITATFEIDQNMLESTLEADVLFNCTTSEGSVGRGVLGPFGVVVLADAERSEQLPVYFYIAKDTDGTSKTYFCADESRFQSNSFFIHYLHRSPLTKICISQ